MTLHRTVRVLAAGGLLAGLAPGGFAQDTEPTRVVVTGSYIPTAESEGPLPVSVYTANQLQKLGAQTPAEGLRQLPSFIGATATENDANAGNGTAFINLRALGAGNTLTLINGRRGFLGSAGTGVSDINAIPIGAIDRAEILKDGASAVYGSDAVAGVVNFIMLGTPGASKPYTGVEIDLLYGNTTNNDAGVRQGYLNAGWANDKLSIVFSANYYNREAIYSRDRRLSSSADVRALGGINTTVANQPGVVNFQAQTQFSDGRSTQGILVNPAGYVTGLSSLRNFSAPPGGGDGFNFRAYTPAIPGQEKFSYYGAFTYKPFADTRLQVYGSALITETRQDNGLAPAPFGLTNNRDGVRQSPFNPFPGPTIRGLNYRLVDELNNRRSGYDAKYYRFDFGVKGDLAFKGNSTIASLNYDFGFVYEEDKTVRTDTGDAKRSLIDAQILPAGTPGAVMTLTNYVLNTLQAPQLLPEVLSINRQFGGTFNPFLGLNTPKAGTANTYNPVTGAVTGTRAYDNVAAARRAAFSANTILFNRNYLLDARVGGQLFPNLPQDGIFFSVGAEYRRERRKDIADPTQGIGDQLGFSQGPTDRFHRAVYSVFGELSIPIITQKMKVPFVRSLDLSGAVRYERFETYGSDPVDGVTPVKITQDNGTTPRLTLRWQPTEELTLRAGWGKSFQAPTYAQYYTPQAQNFPVIFDPLTGRNQQFPNGVFQGGNIAIQPEKSDTYTAGLVYTPKWFKGFTMTIDYYQINTKSLILNPAQAAQLFTTLNARSGAFAIGLNDFTTPGVARLNDGSNLIDHANAPFSNSGKRLVEGIDLVTNYQYPTANWGNFSWTLGWNHFFRWKAEAVTGLGTTNFRGADFGSLPLAPGALPNNKGYLTTDWTYRNLNVVATINYVDGYNNDGSFLVANAGLPIGGTVANPSYVFNRRSREYITLDLQASYEFKKPARAAPVTSKDGKGVRTEVAQTNGGSFWQRLLWGSRIKVGVNNVFDTPPPFDPAAFNDNYDTSTYSIRNRYYYIGLNKKF